MCFEMLFVKDFSIFSDVITNNLFHTISCDDSSNYINLDIDLDKLIIKRLGSKANHISLLST